MSKISVNEFKQRLEAICLGKGGQGFPRKRLDQDILFKSITMLLECNRDYSEKELNQAIEKWLSDVGQAVEIDHVSLRRYLVDAGYISRDPAGMFYRVSTEKMADLFDPETDTIDPVVVIEEAQKRKEEKKRQYLEKL